MSRILVTGGAGFLGSHLIDRLLAQGHTVVAVDNFLTGQKQNIAHLTDHPHFSLIEHDIINPFPATDERFDAIYNLACPASPIHYQQHRLETIKTSTIGMINMLELARDHKARLLQASTSEVYGDPQVHPQTEDYWGHVNPIGPRSCYDEGKRVAETLCVDYQRQYAIDLRLVRIFNTYGPRMHPHDGRVVSNFIIQALTGHPLTLYGQGRQTRSFCYGDDLIEGLVRMMEQTQDHGPINLGNPNEITVVNLAELIRTIAKSSSPLTYKPLPGDDPKQRQPDITRAERVLGWQPRVSLETGLQKTIDYFSQLKLA